MTSSWCVLPFLSVIRDLLVNGEVRETMDAFGLDIGSRDISGRGGCHPLSAGLS